MDLDGGGSENEEEEDWGRPEQISEILRQSDEDGIYFFRPGGQLTPCTNLHLLGEEDVDEEMDGATSSEETSDDTEGEEQTLRQKKKQLKKGKRDLWKRIISVCRNIIITSKPSDPT
eukprot:CAMPEP_0201493788 /NCGR_PEP_ID=MMETSP0151_2-20130828/41773_1 /ASSEMBLY_ACC=CAM_ASM_000257 /TAXON_ID=200890 /ORGANISM="Paramoeba atlantica, Strain 621/1 / CCAP 1560/9" /LENGTH=116 /DNA_ID=CAMNT_0047881503 /DNA_START=282 /DNA_END=628 /DNA_ORIENTATION=+